MKRFLPIYACAAYLFLYLPLLALGAFSFNDSKIAIWRGFTLNWYSGVFHNAALVEGTINSLIIAVTATVVATIVGTLAAYALWQKRLAWLTVRCICHCCRRRLLQAYRCWCFFNGCFISSSSNSGCIR